jgi:hypothetical protein
VSIITLIVTLIISGLVLWLINAFIPMEKNIKQILNIVVVICVVIWLLSVFGIIGSSWDMKVPRLN